MTERHSILPDGIGPHEGREYELMMNGKKHVAIFTEVVPFLFVSNPQSLPIRWIDHHETNGIIFYMPGYEEDAADLSALMTRAMKLTTFSPEIERMIGRILGYSEQEIESFVTHVGNLLGYQATRSARC